MAQPFLTEFLLKISTDPEAYNRYIDADEATRKSILESAGLTEEQCVVMLGGDGDAIVTAVNDELIRNEVVTRGCCQHIMQLKTPPLHRHQHHHHHRKDA